MTIQEALHNCAATILEAAATRYVAEEHAPTIDCGPDSLDQWFVRVQGEHSLDVVRAAAKSLEALKCVACGEPLTIAVTI